MLEKARTCLESKDYSCAINVSDNVLLIDRYNAEALQINREAKARQKEALEQIEIR